MIERGIHLHGHRGPFLIAGIRMGLLALELLESPGYFGIEAESETGTITPLSCLTDGVQIGSGCTTGKGNLRVTGERRPRVHFSTKDGRKVTIELRPNVMQEFREGEINEQSERTQRRPLEELFTWRIWP
jgi:formylmethanofuran dehydrogenase subunit E